MHHKCDCGRGSALDPTGELTALSHLSVFDRAAMQQGHEKGGNDRGGEGKGGERKEHPCC